MACGMMCLPKSVSGLSSSWRMTSRLKTINAHRGQKYLVRPGAEAVDCIFRRQFERVAAPPVPLGFSTKRVMRQSSSICMMPSKPARPAPDGNGGDGDVRAGLDVLLDERAEIHPIQLVAAQNEEVVEVVVQEMDQVFAHGIGRAFIPRGVGAGSAAPREFPRSRRRTGRTCRSAKCAGAARWN